jgi:hypothetical protein
LSRTSQHRKHSSFVGRSIGAHRKVWPATSRNRLIVAAAAACAVLAGAGVTQLITHGSLVPGESAALNRAADSGPSSSVTSPAQPGHLPKHSSPRSARAEAASWTAFGYENPLRGIPDLMPQRIDMGVDFGGAGPIYALGRAVITNAIGDSPGWPGGGWITYRLTAGRAKGLMVYVAEDVTPTVQVGEVVNSSTVIAHMYNGGAGIETGWAQPDGSSAESQLPVAGGISGGGPFPSTVGLNFEELLQVLGVPMSPFDRYFPPSGLLPSGYPTWPSPRHAGQSAKS